MAQLKKIVVVIEPKMDDSSSRDNIGAFDDANGGFGPCE